MSPRVLISSFSTDRLLRCNLSRDTSLEKDYTILKKFTVSTRTSRTRSHPWSAQVWRRSSSSRICHWPPARWGWGASWRWGRAPGTGIPRPPPSLGPAFTYNIVDEWCQFMPAGFYLSCNIFCLNLKWSSRDFSFPLSLFLLIRVVFKFEEVSFFLTEPFESLIVVLWDLSWLVAFKSLLSSEGLSLLEFHVSCWCKETFQIHIYTLLNPLKMLHKHASSLSCDFEEWPSGIRIEWKYLQPKKVKRYTWVLGSDPLQKVVYFTFSSSIP